jgi:predicted ATP-grasp superfamily ATP-dependent carboligase
MMMVGAIVLEGHVQGLSNARSLGELGIPVYVVDVNHCLAQHSKYCKKFFRCQDYQSDGFADFLIELAKKEQMQGWFLIASNDHIVETLSRNYDRLSTYYTMLVPRLNTLEKIIDKRKLMMEAKEVGTHIPDTYDASLIMEDGFYRFPLLIKGSKGLSFYKEMHVKAIQVDTMEELKRVVGNLTSRLDESYYMVQELIPFDEKYGVVSFTCFAVNGEIKCYWIGKKMREHPIKYGTATSAQSIELPDLLEEAMPLMARLNYTGTCEIEFMFDERDECFKLIEINPRTWLWVGLAKACGVDYAKIMYQTSQGIRVDYPQSYEVGVKWINRLTDSVFAFKSIIKGQLPLRSYFKSFKGRKVYAIWSWKDPMPGLIFPFMSFYIAKKRK